MSLSQCFTSYCFAYIWIIFSVMVFMGSTENNLWFFQIVLILFESLSVFLDMSSFYLVVPMPTRGSKSSRLIVTFRHSKPYVNHQIWPRVTLQVNIKVTETDHIWWLNVFRGFIIDLLYNIFPGRLIRSDLDVHVCNIYTAQIERSKIR